MNFLTSCFLLLGFSYCNTENYEDAFGVLSVINERYLDNEYYNKFHFYKAIASHQTLRKEEALTSLNKLDDNFNEIPRRYKNISQAIRVDLESWNRDLSDITRRMNEVKNRLNNNQIGEITQKKQNDIIRRLDELIKEQENAAKAASNTDADANSQTKNKGGQTNSPAGDSSLMGAEGKGKIDEKRLRRITETWGNLTPQERQKVITEVQSDTPAKYKPYIDEYFKSLNRLKR